MNIVRLGPLPVPAGVPAGALATLTMDVAMVAAAKYGKKAFASDSISPEMIGRWSRGVLRGRLLHRDIRNEPAQPGELALGIVTHYATGIVLTQAFLDMPGRGNAKPSFFGATCYGVATGLLPLLIMYPSMGYGWFGRKSGEAARIGRIMLLGHIAFGVGIGLWAPRFKGRRPAADTLEEE